MMFILLWGGVRLFGTRPIASSCLDEKEMQLVSVEVLGKVRLQDKNQATLPNLEKAVSLCPEFPVSQIAPLPLTQFLQISFS